MSILEIEDLRLTIEGALILDGVDAGIDEGAVTAIVGPNGAGKSSLAFVVMGLNGYRDIKGDILFKGESIKDLSIEARAERGITLAWQEPARYEGLTVKNFIDSASADGKNSKSVMHTMGMDTDEYLTRVMDSGLSGGERKKIELASVLAMDPELVLLDEPDSGIDVSSLERIFEAIELLKERGTTVILITHSPTVLEKADWAMLMCGGSIVDRGSSKKIHGYFEDECLPCEHKNEPKEEKLSK